MIFALGLLFVGAFVIVYAVVAISGGISDDEEQEYLQQRLEEYAQKHV